ncbi:MAG: hypothetical protein LBV54_01455 [Puniceicoccales bacterium]|nr:hypothetical protein [Puniceicoccales bacterium]
MKYISIRLLMAFAAFGCVSVGVKGADSPPPIKTEADVNLDAEATIHIKYNAYVRDVLQYAETIIDDIVKYTQRTDDFIGKSSNSAPSWSFSRDSFEKLGKITTRVPNWFSKEDVALFRDNIDLLKTNTAALLKISDELKVYFVHNGPHKADEGKKYVELKAGLETLTTATQKAYDAIRKRSLELADAAETRLAAANSLGSFFLALREDLASAGEINAILSSPDLAKGDAAIGKSAAEKVTALLAKYKESTEKNAKRSHRELVEDTLEKRNRFYADSADFVKEIETRVLPELTTKGSISSSESSRLSGLYGNVVSSYNRFVNSYNYRNQGHAIER